MVILDAWFRDFPRYTLTLYLDNHLGSCFLYCNSYLKYMDVYLHGFIRDIRSNLIWIKSVPRNLYTATEPKTISIPNTPGDVEFWYVFAIKTHYPRLCEQYVTYMLNRTAPQWCQWIIITSPDRRKQDTVPTNKITDDNF